jgi:hypothetical protein
MKEHLIVDVANSFQWSDEQKIVFDKKIKEEFNNYKCLIIFGESEETTFQLLGKTEKVNKHLLKEIIDLKNNEQEIKTAIASLKNINKHHYHDLDYGSYECSVLGIKRVNLLASLLALHKEYILDNL